MSSTQSAGLSRQQGFYPLPGLPLEGSPREAPSEQNSRVQQVFDNTAADSQGCSEIRSWYPLPNDAGYQSAVRVSESDSEEEMVREFKLLDWLSIQTSSLSQNPGVLCDGEEGRSSPEQSTLKIVRPQFPRAQ